MMAADSTRELWALAAALWERSCRQWAVDPMDVRLTGALDVPLDGVPDRLGAAGAPDGIEGIRWLGDRYLASLPRRLRSEHGRFYTPGPLARALATRAFSSPTPGDGLIVDPACGGGSLLGAAVESIAERLPASEALDTILNRLRGSDLDRTAVALAELGVRTALLPLWAALPDARRPDIPRFVNLADGLRDSRPAAVVLANPPFGRCRLSSEERAAYAAVLYGHAHRPTLFLHSAVRRLVPGGTAAFVLPASLVGGAYYQRLRAYLAETAPPAWLGFVQDRAGVFHGEVLQESLLGAFVRDSCSTRVEIERLGGDGQTAGTVPAQIRRGRRPWLVPRDERDLPLIVRAQARERRLRDCGWVVSTGPLVWNRHRDQLFDRWIHGRVPVVWSSDVSRGKVVLSPGRPLRYVEPRQNQAWLVLDRPAILIQRTTAPEQPRRIIAAFLDPDLLDHLGGRVVVENHLNVCTWDGSGAMTPERLLAYLTGDEADRLYRCMTGSVAVSAFELSELPLPDADSGSAVRFERAA